MTAHEAAHDDATQARRAMIAGIRAKRRGAQRSALSMPWPVLFVAAFVSLFYSISH